MPDQSKIESVPIENLRFDPRNPRLPTTIDRHGTKQVLEWMLTEGNIPELMASIGASGYFPGEPLFVVRTNKKDVYEVVEGNRRLTAVKLLNDPKLAPTRNRAVLKASEEAKHKPKELPVIVYNTRKELLDFLAYRHITGVKPWDPLAKARYLGQLFDEVKSSRGPIEEKFRTLARIIGSRSDYVQRLLAGLWLYEIVADNTFFRIQGLNEESIDFGVLTTALTYTNINEFLELPERPTPGLPKTNKDHLRELTSWLFEKNSEGQTRLGESRDLKTLSAVVAVPQALEAFRNGTPLKNAGQLTDEPAEIFHESLLASRANIEQARDHVHLLKKPSPIDNDILDEIQRLTTTVRAAMASLFTETAK
jgi:hypothetical protein